MSEKQIESINFSERQEVRNPRTGKIERVFVNLEAVYPNPNDSNEEMSFEELRAQSRGWTSRNWAAEKLHKQVEDVGSKVSGGDLDGQAADLLLDLMHVQDGEHDSSVTETAVVRVDEMPEGSSRVSRTGRTKKMKIMEVKAETQTGTWDKPSLEDI
jgi:checkpoint serine/threonine-protein kinase